MKKGSESERSENLSSSSEEKFRLLFDSVGDSLFILDTEGNFIDVNRAACQRLGYDRQELLAMNVARIDDPRFADKVPMRMKRLRDEGQAIFESAHRRKDGTVFPVEVNARVAVIGRRQVVFSVVRDITDRKAAERALAEHAVQLGQMNHLRQLFNDIVSHDLLNPASVVYHVSGLLAKKEQFHGVEEIDMLRRNSRRIMQLIRDASTFARVESAGTLPKEEMDLGEILAARAEDVGGRFADRGVTIEMSPLPAAPVVANAMIAEVFENLLDNALKYSPEGGVVTVDLERDGEHWIVSVSDGGDGVPDEYKKSIFERFARREKRGVKGTGLGLAIAKRVVDLHHGSIWVEDKPGGGSRFRVRLPPCPPT